MKQYISLKLTMRGFEVWKCADSNNGYNCNMQVYMGLQNGGSKENRLGYCLFMTDKLPFHWKASPDFLFHVQ